MPVQHLNPDGLHQNPAFTNVVVVSGNTKTIYIGGQNGVDAEGKIVGDFAAQTEQAFKNLEIALAASDAHLEHVIKWNLYVVQGQPLHVGFQAFQRVWGQRGAPPAITFAFVTGLANPEFLIEIEAIAVVPE